MKNEVSYKYLYYDIKMNILREVYQMPDFIIKEIERLTVINNINEKIRCALGKEFANFLLDVNEMHDGNIEMEFEMTSGMFKTTRYVTSQESILRKEFADFLLNANVVWCYDNLDIKLKIISTITRKFKSVKYTQSRYVTSRGMCLKEKQNIMDCATESLLD